MDLNADVGEGYDDAALLPLLTSVNVACGGHAGDAESMARVVAQAVRLELAIGAHPGYPDREHFGRLELDLPLEALARSIEDQLRALEVVAQRAGTTLRHVKPHGALYNQAARDRLLADAIVRAVKRVDPALRLVGLAGSMLLEAGRDAGLETAGEAFADRRYRADGSLAPRTLPGAVIADPEEAAAQALALARGEPIATIDGGPLRVRAETLCVHGDSPGALRIGQAVRSRLINAGIPLKPLF